VNVVHGKFCHTGNNWCHRNGNWRTNTFLETVPGKCSVDSVQKKINSCIGTSHIIRKVLQSETWSQSGGFIIDSRGNVPGKTCDKRINNNNNNNNDNNSNNKQSAEDGSWVNSRNVVCIKYTSDSGQCPTCAYNIQDDVSVRKQNDRLVSYSCVVYETRHKKSSQIIKLRQHFISVSKWCQCCWCRLKSVMPAFSMSC
jgi:hypothetical protein